MMRSLLLVALLAAPAAAQVRIKDVTDVDGARSNQLVGFGLVVGLDGTGSRSASTLRVAADMMQRLNVTATIASSGPNDPVLRSNNISAVMVTAELGPFHRKGGKIDVMVSSVDDAKSLQGGTLIMTPLRGADGQVYAVAQGPVSIGGFSVSGQGAGAGAQKNHLNVGRIANGAMVEKEALGEVFCKGKTRLLLKDPDFNTARLMAKAVNEKYPGYAQAIDGGAVEIGLPPEKAVNPISFISEVGLMEVTPDVPARIVINERTGTVVAGENVTISATAVAHGNLYLFASEPAVVSQPAPFSQGQTTVVTRPQIGAVEQRPKLNVVPKATTVADLTRALNALGVSPRDLISIFQSLKAVGALHAEIVVM
jgi:flagellar P-ring protein FlgI